MMTNEEGTALRGPGAAGWRRGAKLALAAFACLCLGAAEAAAQPSLDSSIAATRTNVQGLQAELAAYDTLLRAIDRPDVLVIPVVGIGFVSVKTVSKTDFANQLAQEVAIGKITPQEAAYRARNAAAFHRMFLQQIKQMRLDDAVALAAARDRLASLYGQRNRLTGPRPAGPPASGPRPPAPRTAEVSRGPVGYHMAGSGLWFPQSGQPKGWDWSSRSVKTLEECAAICPTYRPTYSCKAFFFRRPHPDEAEGRCDLHNFDRAHGLIVQKDTAHSKPEWDYYEVDSGQ